MNSFKVIRSPPLDCARTNLICSTFLVFVFVFVFFSLFSSLLSCYSTLQAPKDKLVCVLNACRLLNQFLSLRLGAIESDRKQTQKTKAMSPVNHENNSSNTAASVESGRLEREQENETTKVAEEEIAVESTVQVDDNLQRVTEEESSQETSTKGSVGSKSGLSRDDSSSRDSESPIKAAVVGADDFLPLLVLLLLRVNPPRLYSNIMFCLRFRHPSRLKGEASYFLTNLHSAVLFILNMTPSSLTIDEKVGHSWIICLVKANLISDCAGVLCKVQRRGGSKYKGPL